MSEPDKKTHNLSYPILNDFDKILFLSNHCLIYY